MRLIAVGFFLGTFCLQFFSHLFFVIVALSCLGGALLIALIIHRYLFANQGAQYTKSILVFLVSVFVGLVYAGLVAHSLIESRLNHALEGVDINVEGVVAEIPERDGKNWRFYLDVDSATSVNAAERLALKGRVKLSWYRSSEVLSAGQRVALRVRLKQPNGFMNQGGFDYERWLLTKRIKATGYVRASGQNRVLSNAQWYSANHLRETIDDRIKQSTSDESGAIIAALAVASRQDISDQQWDLFRQTGTSHLIAISGLHIGMVAGFGYLIVAVLWWLFPVLYQQVPVRVAGAFLAISLAISYAILAGFTLPTQRSLIMVIVVVIALVLRQRLAVSKVLSLAVILILLIDPLATMTASFWLSFGAVVLILLYTKRQQGKPKYTLLSLQLMLSIGMLPLTILFFGTASLISPVANLIAIPWVTLVIVPLILLMMLSLWVLPVTTDALLALISLNTEALTKVLGWLDSLPFTSIDVYALETPYVLAMMLGMLFLFLPKGFPAKWLGILLVVPIFSYQPPKLRDNEAFRYELLDIGQGLASVLQTKHHVLIYDTGPRINTFDTGKLVVVPFLRSKGIKHLDKMILSHEDMDHRGGTEAVLKAVTVGEIISSNTQFLPRHKVKKCKAGQRWQWDGVDFEFLHPSSNEPQSDNNLSCVLRVSTAHHRLLLAADVEKEAESYLVTHYKDKLKADVLLVPHHGSKTSSTHALLEAVDPQFAINSTGYRNKFKHPAKKIAQRYHRHKIPIYDSVEKGMVSLSFPEKQGDISVSFYREDNRKFWYRQ